MSDVQLFEGQTGAEEIWSSKLKFVWLEITGKCNLRCTHCYADSVPEGAHSALSRDEWQSIITDAQEMGAETIQFIGGEPTLHPDFSDLVRFVANSGLKIEVFTNLLHVPSSMWTLFEECQVSLATSFYSSDSTIHDRVTTRVGSQRRMLATIQDALRRSLPLRVGLINVLPEQHVTETEAMLRSIGVSNITVDTVRGIGRGVSHNKPTRPVEALCGQCTAARAAVDPEGWVYPCVFSRWLKIGNTRSERFRDIIQGDTMRRIQEELAIEFFARNQVSTQEDGCLPAGCLPAGCLPSSCQPTGQCGPNCQPAVGCLPPPGPPSCAPRR